MQLFAPKVLRHKAYPAFGIFANVFMGSNDTPVEFRVDNGEWQPMLRVETLDPNVLEINIADARSDKLRSFDAMSEAMLSTHLWRAAVPTNLSAGTHKIEVRTKLNDEWFVESHAYELQPANP